MIHNLRLKFVIPAGVLIALAAFQNCGSFSSAVFSGSSTLSSSNQPEPTPVPAPVTTPLNFYVASNLTRAETCNQPFQGTRPANLSLKSFPSFGGVTVQYLWDYAVSAVWNETSRYGYHPEFNPDRVSFAANGRPIIRDQLMHLQVLTDQGGWKIVDLIGMARESMARQGVTTWPLSPVGSYTTFGSEYADPSISSEVRIVFDDSCHAYAIVNANRTLGYSLLMHSFDGGQSWAAYKIPGSEGGVTLVSMELPVRRHVLSQTPVLLIRQWYAYAGSPNSIKFVIPTKKADGTLDMGTAQLVVQNTVSSGSVGGVETSAVSVGDHIHLAYPGSNLAYDPISGRHGTPQYILTYSRSQQRIIAGPTPLAVTVGQVDETEVDQHNQPAIALDSQNYIHVLMGGHDGPLYYIRSSKPDDLTQWGPVEVVGQHAGVAGAMGDEYTYPSLVIDGYDEPVILARWNGPDYTFRLIFNTRAAGASGKWGEQQVVLDPGRAYYGHWYHKLSIDPWGRLFVSYHYFPDSLFADEARIFAQTYNFTLTPVNGCVATNHNTYPASYCSYTGYEMVNSTVLVSLGLGRPFQLAETANFFF